MLSTVQAAAKGAALIGMVEVKTATLELAAVLMGEASGLDPLNGLLHFQACLSSTGVSTCPSFFAGLPANYGPVGRVLGSF